MTRKRRGGLGTWGSPYMPRVRPITKEDSKAIAERLRKSGWVKRISSRGYTYYTKQRRGTGFLSNMFKRYGISKIRRRKPTMKIVSPGFKPGGDPFHLYARYKPSNSRIGRGRRIANALTPLRAEWI